MANSGLVAAFPVAQRSQDWRLPVLKNGESVGGWFHRDTLSLGGRFCKMPRTVKGKTRFPFRITILPAERPKPNPPWVGSSRWKRRAIYTMKMKLSIQIEKASRRAGLKWFSFYSVRGYGAPGVCEFVCPYSGMIAKTINQEEAASVRRYWALCADKSREILEWLCRLDQSMYSAELHRYLLRIIVVPYGAREIRLYESSNPFV